MRGRAVGRAAAPLWPRSTRRGCAPRTAPPRGPAPSWRAAAADGGPGGRSPDPCTGPPLQGTAPATRGRPGGEAMVIKFILGIMRCTEITNDMIGTMLTKTPCLVQLAPKVRSPFGSLCLISRVFTVILLRLQTRSNIHVFGNIKSKLIAIKILCYTHFKVFLTILKIRFNSKRFYLRPARTLVHDCT